MKAILFSPFSTSKTIIMNPRTILIGLCLFVPFFALGFFFGTFFGVDHTRNKLSPELSRNESYYVAGLHRDPTLVFTVTDAHGVELRELPTSLRMGGVVIKKTDMLSFDSESGEWKIKTLSMPQ